MMRTIAGWMDNGKFIIEKDGKKEILRVEVHPGIKEGVIEKPICKEIASYDLKDGSRTPGTDTVSMFIKEVLEDPKILQEVFSR